MAAAKPRIRPRANFALLEHARPMAFGGSASYAAASSTKNMLDWTPTRGSPDADLVPEQDSLVARSRDMIRNSGVAAGGIQTIVDNVVGTGLRLTPRPNYRALGKDKAWADAWSADVYAAWLGWADTTACDAADSSIFDAMTAQEFRAWLMNGEGCAIPLWIPDRGDGWSTKIQTIEADRLSNPHFKQDDARLRAGIEYDKYGAPVAFHVRKTHPGDWLMGRLEFGFGEWQRIPRRTPFGRLRFLHMYDRERAGQSRGRPQLSSVMREHKQIDRYTAAAVDGAVLDAMAFGTIETPMDQESIENLFQEDPTKYLEARDRYAVGGFASGTVIPMMPGDKFVAHIPTRPATAFGSFVENSFRIMACGYDMPYELLLKDWSKTNYSSGRAAMLEAWRTFNRRRDTLGTQWCDPVYGLWLEEAVNANIIKAPGFYQNRAAYQRAWWIGPGRGWVDPVKEATAASLRIEGKFSTLERECAEQGLDWRDVLEQLKTEDEYLARLGLQRTDSAKPAGPAANQPIDVDDEDVKQAINEAAAVAVARIMLTQARG